MMVPVPVIHPFLAVLEGFETTPSFWWRIIILVALVLMSGFFSSSEIALFRVSKAKRRHLMLEGDTKMALVDKMMSNPNRVLITILLGNNLVNIAAAAIATQLALEMFGEPGIGIATGVMTFVVLIVGEITPKAYAARYSLRVSKRVTPGLRLIEMVLFPFIWILERITDGVFRLFGVKRKEEATFASPDELRTLIDVGTEEGVIEEEEQEMIHGVISFGELMAKEVMVPRTDMVCLERSRSLRDAVEVAVSSGYSRLPVYEGNMDNVVGVLYVKDLLRKIVEGETDAQVGEYMRESLFVPESKALDEILEELQDKRVHLAVVVDEFGGTSGIVTMEDLLEEIVGEIFDEYDLRRESIVLVQEDTWLVDARIHVDDVNEALDTKIPEEEAFETMGGFIHHELGRLPKEGERFEAYGLRITVEKVVGRRILKIRLERIAPYDGDEDDED
ncbi:MAG: hemolysin family protein [Euryarchaeota archaeon]|nr:hemolysin family protein [Euryarchaeota archaeon]